MKKNLRALLAGAAVLTLIGLSQLASAADRPYTEGSVSEVTAIKTLDGMTDDYMAWLAGPWKQYMEELKKGGVVTGYRVYTTVPRNPQDPDLYLEVIYKNMAALDNLEARSDAIGEKVFGPMQKANADTIGRGKMRTVLGSELIREVNFK